MEVSSTAVIVITVVLFVVSVFLKGLTHELLLEVAVFLVSVKLIIVSEKNELIAKDFGERLSEIRELLEKRS